MPDNHDGWKWQYLLDDDGMQGQSQKVDSASDVPIGCLTASSKDYT